MDNSNIQNNNQGSNVPFSQGGDPNVPSQAAPQNPGNMSSFFNPNQPINYQQNQVPVSPIDFSSNQGDSGFIPDPNIGNSLIDPLQPALTPIGPIPPIVDPSKKQQVSYGDGSPESGPSTQIVESSVEPTVDMGQEKGKTEASENKGSEKGKESYVSSEQQKQPAQPKKKLLKEEKPKEEDLDPAFNVYGYKVSKHLAKMRDKFSRMSGKGNVSLSKTWLIILLDRLLKVEANKSKNKNK